jgi:hypothetical protein
MALIVPRGPEWGYCTDNTNLAAAQFGTTVSAGANNADGTTVTLLTALAHDVELLMISMCNYCSDGSLVDTLADILIDPAGGTSWVSLIDDLLANSENSAQLACSSYAFPVWIPAGASVGARARNSSTGTSSGSIHIQAYGGNANPGSWWCGQKVTSIGVNPASSRGTNVTPGVSGAWGSWTDLGSPLPYHAGAIQYGAQGETGTAWTSRTYKFQFGVSDTKIGPAFGRTTTSKEGGYSSVTGPIFASIPAGSQLRVRGLTSSTTGWDIDVAAYVVS